MPYFVNHVFLLFKYLLHLSTFFRERKVIKKKKATHITKKNHVKGSPCKRKMLYTPPPRPRGRLRRPRAWLLRAVTWAQRERGLEDAFGPLGSKVNVPSLVFCFLALHQSLHALLSLLPHFQPGLRRSGG